jgi:hypothetical protein
MDHMNQSISSVLPGILSQQCGSLLQKDLQTRDLNSYCMGTNHVAKAGVENMGEIEIRVPGVSLKFQ